MQQVHSILVIGAGIGGLAAAAAFARRGAEVTVVERRTDGEVLGVGINQPANSLRVLRALGVLEEIAAHGYCFDRLQFFDRDGGLVVEIPSSLGGDVPANIAVSRSLLAGALKGAATQAGAKIRYGLRPDAIDQDVQGVDIIFNDGSTGRYDLVLAFDGMGSRTRRILFGAAHEPRFTGCAVWRVTVARHDSVTCCQLFHGIDTKAGLIPITPEQMYLFLVSKEPGNPHYEPAQFHTMLTERLVEYGGLIGQIRDSLTTGDDIVYSPLSEVMLPAPWHKGRVVVAGDAAHLSAPHLTQGAAMALEDALLLAELVDRELPLGQSLETFAERRRPRVQLVQNVSRGILMAEMAVTPETYAASLAELKEHLPGRLGMVEGILNGVA